MMLPDFIHVKCVIGSFAISHHGMACSPVADGGQSLCIWQVAVNILKKQLLTANKESSSVGVGQSLTIPPHKKPSKL